MAKGFDGSIRIDTSIEDKGFNAGLKKLSTSAKAGISTVAKTVGRIGLSIGVTMLAATVAVAAVVVSVVRIGVALAKAGIQIAKFGVRLVETMAESVDKTSKLGQMLAGLTTSFNNVKGALYGVAATIITAVEPYIQRIVDWLIKAANYASMFIAALLGKKTVYQYVAGSMEASAEAAKALTKNTKKAGDAAKGALAAFDDLNVLTKETAEETTAPDGGGGGGMSFVETPVSPEIVTQVEEVKEKIHVIWGEIGEFLQDPFQYIANWIYDHVNKPIENWFKNTWENIKQWAIDLWSKVLENWEIVKTRVKEQMVDPIKKTFSEMWENVKQWAMDVWAGVVENWEIFKTRIKEQIIDPIKKSFSETWENIKQWAEDTWDKIILAWDGAGEWFREKVTDPIKEWFNQSIEDIKQFFSDAWTNIQDIWKNVETWFKDTVTDPIKTKFTELWDGVKTWASDAWTNIQDIWTKVSDWFKANVTEPVSEFFSTAWENIQGFFSGAWDKIVEIWGGIGEWIRINVTDPIQEKFGTALDWVKGKWEEIFGGIGDFFKGIVNTIIDLINGMLWGMTEGINAVIGALNSLSITIPEWVPGIGGNSFGVNIPYVYPPQIPRLATGAVIPPNSEFLAILGDQRSGRNIETPESLLRQIVAEALDGAGQELKVTMPVYLDSEKIYEGQKRVQFRRGKSLVTGGAT